MFQKAAITSKYTHLRPMKLSIGFESRTEIIARTLVTSYI
jgi:hypothetical protein